MSIEREIINAKDKAPTSEELQRRKDIEIKLCKQFLSGEINLAYFLQKTDLLIHSGRVVPLKTTDDLRYALKLLGFDNDFIESNVNHEIAHYNKAQKMGVPADFGIQLARLNEGYLCNALVSVRIPPTFSDEFARAALKEIIEAPGKDMSSGDLALLSQ